MQTDWLQMLDEYWDKKYTPYSDYYDFQPDWLYQYFNELPLGKAIESAYIMWKLEQHRLTTKHEIMCLLVPLVEHYFGTMEEYTNPFKISCQRCSGFVTCKGRSI